MISFCYTHFANVLGFSCYFVLQLGIAIKSQDSSSSPCICTDTVVIVNIHFSIIVPISRHFSSIWLTFFETFLERKFSLAINFACNLCIHILFTALCNCNSTRSYILNSEIILRVIRFRICNHITVYHIDYSFRFVVSCIYCC